MKHLTQEQCMEFLYGELSPENARHAEQHLIECAECSQKMEGWRGAQQKLQQWELPPVMPGKTVSHPAWQWKWAAAAVLVLTSAFAVGRVSSPKPDLAAIQKELAEPLRASVEAKMQNDLASSLAAAKKEIEAEFSRKLSQASEQMMADANRNLERNLQSLSVQLTSWRDEDKAMVIAALKEMESQRLSDILSLRKDLETLAVQAEQSFRNAQKQLVQLANYTQPDSTVNTQP